MNIGKDVVNRKPYCTNEESSIDAATMENSVVVPQKT